MSALEHEAPSAATAAVGNPANTLSTLIKEAPLQPGESVWAALETDLNERLRFGHGTILLTNTRIVARLPGEKKWQSRDLLPGLTLRHTDHAGVGTLQLGDATGQLAVWRFTLGHNPAALALLAQFEHIMRQLDVPPPQRQRLQGEPDEDAAPPAESEKPPSTWTLFRLWRFARPYKGRLLAGFVLTLAATAATLVPPYLTMPLMDKVLIPFQNGQAIDAGYVAMLLTGLLGSALLAWALGWSRTYILSVVSERMGADLRTTTYDHLLRLSLEYFGSRRTGDLMARIGSDTDRINTFLSLHLLDFATDVLMMLMTAAILFSIDPKLALVTLAPLPVIAWLIHTVRDRLRTGFEKLARVWAEVTNVLADTIPGIRVVKAFAQEGRESERFRTANRHNFIANDRLNRLWSLFTPTVTLLTEIGLLIVWAFGIWQVSRHAITVGVLTAFVAYIGRFYTRLDSMSRIVSVTQKAATGTRRIFEILDNVQGRIEVRHAAMRYGNRSVIRDLSLTIEPGEMVGLVGHSGSGKSTLVNLICRFYDVTEGAILVDGVDLRQVRVADYRRHIGLVLQEPFLFFGTVAENIAYG